jgi:predicted metal-binding membrane protein
MHGLFCLGCCWLLTVLLFVGGLMNLLWIAALALLVLIEKLLPLGPHVRRLTGIALIVWGAIEVFE